MTPQPREQYQVAHVQYGKLTLNIIPRNAKLAGNGDEYMQRSIIWQFFKTLGRKYPPSWEWEHFKVTPTGVPGRPPSRPTAKPKQQAHVPLQVGLKEALLQQTQSCACIDRVCVPCDVGYHGNAIEEHDRCQNGCSQR